MTETIGALPPLASLLAAHAGGNAERQRAIWAFDARLAGVARTTSEAMIGQMRLAWWNDVIGDAAGVKGKGEPVVDAMRASGAMDAPGLAAMIDGWEVLVVEPDLDAAALADYATGRGGGLFRALADVADAPEWLIAAGRAWALWDLAGHVGDAALADAAIAQGRAALAGADAARWPRAWKPLRIAFTLARQDLRAGRGAAPGMPRGQALRLLRIALVGR
jgi:phytoene synthase